MKIAVVGCGALGSYYGARILQAGEEVHFLLRSDYGAVAKAGVTILSDSGDFTVNPQCALAPESIGICDLVLIGLKTTANHLLSSLLSPLVGPDTVLLTLQNGLGNEEVLASSFRSEAIMGGLCFVCLNRIRPGVVRHLGYGRVVLGEYAARPGSRTHETAELFRRSGIPCEIAEDLARAHWEKLVWNIPFNGLGVAGAAGYDAVVSGKLRSVGAWGPPLPTDQLLGDSKWAELVLELMNEIVAIAGKSGFSIPASLADRMIDRTRAMGAYKASTLVDFERGKPIELESLFLKPLGCGQRLGVNTPRLEALCRVLSELDASVKPERSN